MHVCAKMLLVGCVFVTSIETAVAENMAKAKILLIPTKPDHPWALHMYCHECGLLAKCLNQNVGIEASVSPDFDWPKDPAVLKDVKSIVYYSRPAGDIILSPARRDDTRRLLKSGVGFVAIHWATGANDKKLGPDWVDVLSGWFNMAHCGLKVDRRPLVQVQPDHPICRGWKQYDLRDEFYLNLKFHPDAKPMLRVNVNGKDQVVGWILERKDSRGGRSFGTTLGHFHDNFGIESFRRAIVNGILWTAHVEVPKDGAKVDITSADLKLPPKP